MEGRRKQYEAVPDLLVVDGVRASSVRRCRALVEMGMEERVPVVGLAKQHEWIFRPGERDPVILPPGSKGLSLITHLRDEAHRFAITYHRKLRQESSQKSILDDAPRYRTGQEKVLIAHFGSFKKLMKPPPEEIARVEGFGPKLSQALHLYLHGSAPVSMSRPVEIRSILRWADRKGSRLTIVPGLLLVFFGTLDSPRSFDLWYYMRMGKEILQTHSIPHHTNFLRPSRTRYRAATI